MSVRVPCLFLSAFLSCSIWGWSAAPEEGETETAWERLLREDPRAADDPSLSMRDRLILYALTPAQADAYYRQGRSAEDLILERGRSLAQYLQERLESAGQLYVPVATSCRLFSGQVLEAGERRRLWARGEDLSLQGGEEAGCRIPEEARTLVLRLGLEAPLGGGVKLWAADAPQPAREFEAPATSAGRISSTVFVSLCRQECSEGDFQLRGSGDVTLEGEVVGYFRALRVSDVPRGGVRLSTEGGSNNFFGSGAGDAITTGSANSFFGGAAGNANTTGDNNSFFGHKAGSNNEDGGNNSFFGKDAGLSNESGTDNAFFGHEAGKSNTASDNSFFGSGAGAANTSATENTFVGFQAGYSNTLGHSNTFIGYQAGYSNIGTFLGSEGSFNTFIGYQAGYSNTSGRGNSFFGHWAGQDNNGTGNTFLGQAAGYHNTTGQENVYVGNSAGLFNTTGSFNSLLGLGAGLQNTTGSSNSFLGYSSGYSNTVEDNNTFIGYYADIDPGADPGSSPVTNATALGYRAYVSQSNSLVLGSINGVHGATVNVNVGIGTTAPQASLHVVRTDGTAGVRVEENSATRAGRQMFVLRNNGPVQFRFQNSDTAKDWVFLNSGQGTFKISLEGTGVPEAELSGNGDFEIRGDLTANGMVYSSDRNLKTDLVAINPREILRKVSQLPISQWRFKQDPVEIRHNGPMAQDFYAAFRLGRDERHINPADISGVALAAIQGLAAQVQEQQESLQRQEEKIRALEDQLRQLLQKLGNDIP